MLFGSWGRGDHGPKSDIDLAVYGGSQEFSAFAGAVEDEAWTLLQFDLIDMNARLSAGFTAGVEREGVVLYEKIWRSHVELGGPRPHQRTGHGKPVRREWDLQPVSDTV
ncbi:MAG: nucleotidyltransferase domain-containing protein [Fretibacterium sp.]|nr:nucleotidyltransferase domain-containing protein [Fretibacterium sp.]